MNNRIEEIDVRNYMRVRKAHLTVDGNTLVVSGDNEQGKSSFVQAIQDIFGGAESAPTMPIRKGATEAVVMVRVCRDGTKLKATLTHTKGNRRLVVTNEENEPQKSPQAIMAAFWADTSFDPSLFLISKADDQVRMLKRLAGLDFTKLDEEAARIYAERTNVNRDAERLMVEANGKPSFPDAPKAEQGVADLSAEVDAAQAHNQLCQERKNDEVFAREHIKTAEQRVTDAAANVESLKRSLATAEQKLAEMQGAATAARDRAATAMKAAAEMQPKDIAVLRGKLTLAEEVNKKVRANAEKAAVQARARAKQAESEKITDRLAEIAETKAEQLRNAKFPIPGMTLSDDGVLIDGVPLDQQSDMRRVAIGVEMAAVLNPDRPLMLVRHGNLFTPANFHILEEIAAKRNLTCIVEIPGKNIAGSKLVFEDGVGAAPGDQIAALASTDQKA